MNMPSPPTFESISGLNEAVLRESWKQDGVLIIRGLLDPEKIKAYREEREKLIGGTELWGPGWPDPCPYLRVPTMTDLATSPQLVRILRNLMPDQNPVGLHLCLTGFKSTERKWHQDRYLNPEDVGDRYIAVWMALGDVREDAGPFQFVRGSHLWPVIEREKVFAAMRERGHPINPETWPSDSQDWVAEACEDYIRRKGAKIESFTASAGDVLIWHASLMHRGSKPKDPKAERPALIAHYSGIHARRDFGAAWCIEGDRYYWNFPQFLAEKMSTGGMKYR